MRRRVFIAGLTLVVALGAEPVSGQGSPSELDGPQFGIGYAANAPNLMAGAAGYVLLPFVGGVGLYVDAKFDVQDPTGELGFDASLTADEVVEQVPGAEFIRREVTWQSFNVALVRPVSGFLMVYGGVGYVGREYYHYYQVVEGEVGDAFSVAAPEDDDSGVNVLFGIFMRLGPRFSSQFGFETEPGGMTVGLSLRHPRW